MKFVHEIVLLLAASVCNTGDAEQARPIVPAGTTGLSDHSTAHAGGRMCFDVGECEAVSGSSGQHSVCMLSDCVDRL